MTSLSVSSPAAGPAAIDRNRQSLRASETGSAASPTWTRRAPATAGHAAIGPRPSLGDASHPAPVAHRAVSVPGDAVARPSSAALAGSPRASEAPSPDAAAHKAAAADEPTAMPNSKKDSLSLLAPVKLVVTLAALGIGFLIKKSGQISDNVQAWENDPRNQPQVDPQAGEQPAVEQPHRHQHQHQRPQPHQHGHGHAHRPHAAHPPHQPHRHA